MKFLPLLLLLTGCASAPFVCESTDANTCLVLQQLHQAEQRAAYESIQRQIGGYSQPQQPLPRNHRESMCAAGAVNYC